MALKTKLLEMLRSMGCSANECERVEQLFDDEDDGAQDDLDEIVPLKGGKPRELKAEDMATSDPYRKMRAYATAQDLVRRHTGHFVQANDAAGVLRKGIGLLGFGEIDSGLPRAALPEVWRLAVRQANAARYGNTGSASHRGGSAQYAMDSKQAKSFAERFPTVAAVRKAPF